MCFMSMEFTGINKETVAGEIKNFLESCSDDTVFKMVINSKRGHLKITINRPRKDRIKKFLNRLKRKRSNP